MTFTLDGISASPSVNAMPQDAMPDLSGEIEFPCSGCGTALEYGGRGRKPKWCAECKPRRNGGTARAIPSGSNDKMAATALDILCQGNAALSMGAMLIRLNRTASKIGACEDGFRIQAYEALKTDPSLCKLILKGGATSGKMMLVLAYGMLGAAVAPIAIEEFKERQAEKQTENDVAENVA